MSPGLPEYDAAATGPLGPWAKGVPVSAWGRDGAGWVASGPHLADLPTPVMTLDAAAVAANLAAMAGWAAGAGVDLAPHGKTSMAPALWRAQLAAGAWAVTVATPWQLAVALDAGVPRVLVAGPLLDADVHGLVARTTAPAATSPASSPATPAARVLAWVDGEDVVAATAAARAEGLARTDQDPAGTRPLDVLVELGAPGARTGARSVAAALAVARATAAAPGLRLAGVAGYEGALAHDASPASMAAVRAWLRDLRSLHEQLLGLGLLDTASVPDDAAVVSAGGSAYFDVVAEELADLHDPAGQHGPGVRVVVRAGASAAHDDGFYAGITPATRGTGPELRAGLHAWARVISRPEPGLALLDAGRRDLPFDEGLPVVRARRPGGRGPAEPLEPGAAVVTAVNDQHAFVRLAAGRAGGGGAEHLAVGDVLQLGLSHPCTAFDKWGLVPVVDDASLPQPRVVDLLRTVFG
ncbi:amino acid deaminase [Quadrisphaera sp. INWT6]|uniref:amino acid deaminase n=1 Tax=Quadrisphaera sp. INWT6 TaxID=2596917 RepID=UPI00189234B8|nr:amino acid deaminase [Quadrisphaera sp. INWT6]MBF5080267.1 amino acid deaminase [Quadrisphaera sp. INWT6]